VLSRILLSGCIFSLFLGLGCQNSVSKHSDQACSNPSLDYTALNVNNQCAWISAHRGGPAPLYPENCLETMQFCADSIDHHLILEIDVRTSKDGILYLMHDRSVDRTTNGTGMIAELNSYQINDLYLTDHEGQQTTYRIPSLLRVLNWLKNTPVFLTLDVKRGTDYRDVINLVKEQKIEDQCFIITYSIDAAEAVQRIDKEFGISLSVRGMDELERYRTSSLWAHNRILAFTGTRKSELSLYQALEQKAVPSIIGTIGNLDRQAESKGNQLYDDWVMKGIDIIATDRPYQLAEYWGY